jgi:hypothetical protein
MDPTTIFCPHLACPASGQVGQGHRGSHSRQAPRLICQPCHHTLAATPGTLFSRRRTSAARVVTVGTRRAPAGPLMRRLMARGRRGAAPGPRVCCTDGLGASRRAMRETCRDPVPTGR